jgi:hypothetical protein
MRMEETGVNKAILFVLIMCFAHPVTAVGERALEGKVKIRIGKLESVCRSLLWVDAPSERKHRARYRLSGY